MLVIEWYYLLILQAVIFAFYYLIRYRHDAFELSQLFQSKIHFLILNSGVILTCYYLNTQRQLFCIPVAWTSVLLILFCIAFLAFPFVNKNSRLFPFICAFAGVGFFISLYITLFGRQEYLIFMGINLILIAIVLLPAIWLLKKSRATAPVAKALWFYPAFIFTPYFIIYQLLFMFRSLHNKIQKRLFIFSSVFLLTVGLAFTYQINELITKISASRNKEHDLRILIKNPINNYLIELILGAHWKYHTELCTYDGWRPPFHDPVLVIANKILFPFGFFDSGLDEPMVYDRSLYAKLYPDRAIAFDCRCARNELLLEN